ncbi:hypothetical protein Tco_0471947 [Tanacetum coccineum]
MKTPMSSDTKLTKDEECESVDNTKYRGMIGSLLYLTTSRSNIMFNVCLCARFQEDPKTSHLEAVRRIFRYIKGTTHLELWYLKATDIETVVYADSDHAGDYVDRKSTSGSPYQTNPPSPNEIKLYVQEEWEGRITRIRQDKVIDVEDNQILTREIITIMKIRSESYNLAFFVAKRMEFVTKQARLFVSYGMLLTHLFKYVMFESPELSNDSYVLYDRVMYPFTAQQKRKTRKDCGTRRGRSSTSSSSAFGQPFSSHPNDDDCGKLEGGLNSLPLFDLRFMFVCKI